MSVMYEFELEIAINRKSFFRTITADTFQEALEFGHLMYPEAEYVEIAWYFLTRSGLIQNESIIYL